MNPIAIDTITNNIAAVIYDINDEIVTAGWIGEEPKECELLWNDAENAYFFLDDMLFYVGDFMKV